MNVFAPLRSHSIAGPVDEVDLAAFLAIGRFDLSTEAAAQTAIHAHLVGEYGAGRVQREFRLSKTDRPDFLVDGRIVVEVKVKGARKMDAYKQLERYAKHERVTHLILATSQSMNLPSIIGGKPARLLSLGRAWL